MTDAEMVEMSQPLLLTTLVLYVERAFGAVVFPIYNSKKFTCSVVVTVFDKPEKGFPLSIVNRYALRKLKMT